MAAVLSTTLGKTSDERWRVFEKAYTCTISCSCFSGVDRVSVLTMGIKVQSLLMVGGHHGQSGLSAQEVAEVELSLGKENVQDHCKNRVILC